MSKSTFFPLLAALFIVSTVFAAHSTALAQSLPGITNPITFAVDPQFPAPNSTVTMTAQSYSTDLTRASFSWYVNGKLFQKGNDITSISVPVGTSAVSISVDVTTNDIGTFSDTETVHPGTVDLLWQTDGYTPPFYQGKALEAYGSYYKVTAVPELLDASGKKINPKTLVYTWQKNGNTDATQSGYGKDSYTDEQSSYVRGEDAITVSVSSVTHDAGATGEVDISPTIPEVVFYEDSPLYGIVYQKALQNSVSLAEQELTLRAEPFNISTANPLSGGLTFDWSLNGASVPAFAGKNEVTLRSTGQTGGESDVSLTVQDSSQPLQGGQAAISIFQ